MKLATIFLVLGLRAAQARDDGNSNLDLGNVSLGFDPRANTAIQAIQDEQELVGVDKAAIDFEATASKLVDEAPAQSKTLPDEQLEDAAAAMPDLAAVPPTSPGDASPEAAALPKEAAAPSADAAAAADASSVAAAPPAVEDVGASGVPTMPPSLRGATVQTLLKEMAAETAEREKTKQAEVMLHNRLVTLGTEDAKLRESLSQAVRWGSDLAKEMQQAKQKVAAERKKIREALSAKEKEINEQFSQEKTKEQHLQERLKDASQALGARSDQVSQLEKRLLITNSSSKLVQEHLMQTVADLERAKERQDQVEAKQSSEIRALRLVAEQANAEANQTKLSLNHALVMESGQLSEAQKEQRNLRGQLAKEQTLNRELQERLQTEIQLVATRDQSLQRTSGKVKKLKSNLAAEKVLAKKAQQSQDAFLKREATQESDLHWLRSVKASDEEELKNLKAKYQETKLTSQSALTKEQQQVQQLQFLLEKEREEKTASERSFKERLDQAEQHALKEKARADKNKAKVAEVKHNAQQELDRLNAQLQEERKHEDELLKERADLRAEVDVNISKVLASEDARKKAEAEAAQATNVTRQLSSTVPQLLKQERLAHEQEEAEKAMRVQAQNEAKKQIDKLEQQFSSLLKDKNKKVATTVKPTTADSDDDDDDAPVTEDSAAVTKALKEATPDAESQETVDQQQQTAASTVAPHDLAKDSVGLNQLLGSALSTPTSPPSDDDDA